MQSQVTKISRVVRLFGKRVLFVLFVGIWGGADSWLYAQEETAGNVPQKVPSANRTVYIDDEGIIRWQDDQEEVTLFGVNYCLPSGYPYRALGYVKADPKQAVESDMAHLARLGLDGMRLSFWGDWENSDQEGNLVDNEHLDLLDYVIAQASKRGIYVLLTPITLYSPVWPQPEETNTCQGFPRFYPKRELGINPQAIRVQQRYLSGILNHVNRYTGLAYKDEPAIVFFEPVNEPHHHPDKNPVDYINALMEAIRNAGYTRPVFFNVSQDMSIAPAVRDSRADGASFGWYPSGLMNGVSLECNFLPRVDSYRPMFDPALKGRPKVVYEFDAADVAGSYMYPAMARTYRSAGVQFAAMFSYDPLVLASKNLEYQTHCLNLVYTPGKAVSLMIAAEAFRRLPRFQSYGRYPEGTRFGPVRVSYREDLSELITDREFFYSNSTQSLPPNPGKLERVVGCGSSPVVHYGGTGAYFLEKLAPGAWRLEVYPDVVWIHDPFGRPSRGRQAAHLIRRERKMKLSLPDPGPEFSLTAIDKGNSYQGRSSTGEFSVVPGVYLLKKEGIVFDRSSASAFGNLGLDEYVVPAPQKNPVSVRHCPPRQIAEGRGFVVAAQVASDEEPAEVTLSYRSEESGPFQQLSMKKTAAYQYTAEIPSDQIRTGILDYAVSVRLNQETLTFPARTRGRPAQGLAVDAEPIAVYEAASAPAGVDLKQWFTRDASAAVAKNDDNHSVLRVSTSGFEPNGSVSVDLALASKKWPQEPLPFEKERYEEVVLVLKGRRLIPQTRQVQMTLTDQYKMVETRLVSLEPDQECRVHLKDFCIANLRSVRFTIGAWLYPGSEDLSHGFEVEQIALQPSPVLWRVPVVSAKSPFVLFDAAADSDRLIFPNSEHRVRFTKSMVPGSSPGAAALRVEVPAFEPSPHDVSFRLMYDRRIQPRRVDLGGFHVLCLRARAAVKETTCLELDLIRKDGSVWGTAVPLTTAWQEIEIPLSGFRPAVATWLPRSYPTVGFDYWDQGNKAAGGLLDLKDLEALQVSFGSRMFPDFTDARHAFEIEEIGLDTKAD